MDGTRHVTASGGGGGEGGGGEGDDGANLSSHRGRSRFSSSGRQLSRRRKSGRQDSLIPPTSEAAAAAAAAAATAAAIEAATPRTQAALLADEALALELQQQGDDEDDALEAARALSAQEAGVAAGRGEEERAAGWRRPAAAKGGERAKAASPDKGAKKGKGSSLAAALTGGGKGGKGSAYFAVDIDDCGGRLERAVIEIGARQTITSLNKKWLAKPIRKGLVEPFVSQLAPHLKSQGIEIASDESSSPSTGARLRGWKLRVSSSRGAARRTSPCPSCSPSLFAARVRHIGRPVARLMAGRLPRLRRRKQPPTRRHGQGQGGGSRSLLLLCGRRRGRPLPRAPQPARFGHFPRGHLDAGKDDVVPTETTLPKKWLAKPLRQGLVLPALKAYMAQSWQADLNHLPITILVDGIEVDGTSPEQRT